MTLLEYHCRWIQQQFDERHGQNLYWIMASLDPLLTADEISVIRSLGKRLVQLRKHCVADAADSPRDDCQQQQITRFNIILTVIQQHFGQKDIR